MKYAEELKIKPNLLPIFISTANMLKLVKQLRLGRSYLTRMDLVHLLEPVHEKIFHLYGMRALIEETEFCLSKHCTLNNLRKRFTMKLFFLMTKAFPDMEIFTSKESLLASTKTLEIAYTRSIIRSAVANRLPRLTLVTLQQIGKTFRRTPTYEIPNKSLAIVNVLAYSSLPSPTIILNNLSTMLAKHNLTIGTIEECFYPDIYTALYESGLVCFTVDMSSSKRLKQKVVKSLVLQSFQVELLLKWKGFM